MIRLLQDALLFAALVYIVYELLAAISRKDQ